MHSQLSALDDQDAALHVCDMGGAINTTAEEQTGLDTLDGQRGKGRPVGCWDGHVDYTFVDFGQ